MLECPECQGSGEAEYEVAVVDYVCGGYYTDQTMTCQLCDGFGLIEPDDLADA